MKWWTAAIVLFSISAGGADIDPVCHEYYEVIQSPGLTYEDIGRIAEAMYQGQCWPAMQKEIASTQTQTAGGLPNCEYLGEQLVKGSTDVRKLFDVRPIVREDCPRGYLLGVNLSQSDTDLSKLRYNTGHGSAVWLTMAECNLLVDNPAQLSKQKPKLGLRPVNCRGKILYADGSKAGFYLYMEQYPDGDRGVWGANVEGWSW